MKLVLGAAQFGMPYGITNYNQKMPTDLELKAILDCAFNNGIQTIDTAEAYGEANSQLKKYHDKSNHRFQIINKILRFPIDNIEQLQLLKEALKREKENLDILKFECIMLHHAPSINKLITQDFFRGLKEEGICEKVGLSINNKNEYFLKDLKIEVLQAPLNILNQNVFNTNFITHLKSRSCSIHVRSIFLQGLLLAGSDKVPPYLSLLGPHIKEIEDLSRDTGASLKTLCFAFILSNEFVDKIVIGVQSQKELIELLESYQKALKFKENNRLIEWDKYNCKRPLLIDPTHWNNLEKK